MPEPLRGVPEVGIHGEGAELKVTVVLEEVAVVVSACE